MIAEKNFDNENFLIYGINVQEDCPSLTEKGCET